jgi:sortase A
MTTGMRRPVIIGIAVVFLLFGMEQVGQGVWIYAKAHLAQRLLQRAWERAAQGDARPKPWPWADTWPVARLQVPKHGIDLIVLAGASSRTLAFGPAQISVTSHLRQSRTTILTGHRDTHFRFLDRLESGDEIFVQTPSREWYRYRVMAHDIVGAGRASIVHSGRPALALVTCYPFDAVVPGGPLRYVVTAEHVSFEAPTALR